MFPILPSDAGYDNGGAPQLPVGTGPYAVTSYQQGKSIALKANPDWWRTAPLISDVNVLSYPDNPTEISSLVLRQLDAVQTDSLTVTQYRDSGDARVYEYPTRYFEYMALNFTSPDLQDQKIRQAIAYALNRQEIISYTYVNHATITDSPIPPNEGWINGSNLITYDHDTTQARQLIELDGWQDNYDKDGNPLKDASGNPAKDKDGKPLIDDSLYDTSPDGIQRPLQFTLLTNMDQGNTLRNDAAVLIKDQLAAAGINVTIKSESWNNYTTDLKQKNFDLALCGCYLSPVPDYTALLGTGGSLNVGGYSDPDFDAMLLDILQTSDASTLKVKMGELQKKVVDQLPIISLYFRTHSLMYSPDVLGVTGAKEDNAFASISQWYRGS
jgi:peptide/nickel transport system substrate-binding protein